MEWIRILSSLDADYYAKCLDTADGDVATTKFSTTSPLRTSQGFPATDDPQENFSTDYSAHLVTTLYSSTGLSSALRRHKSLQLRMRKFAPVCNLIH